MVFPNVIHHRFKTGSKLRQSELQGLPHDVALAQIGNLAAFVDLSIHLVANRRRGQPLRAEYLCFHCLRVTYVNRLRRAGVPREAAMRLVNHASELIHQICQREKVKDVAQWRDAVQFAAERGFDRENSKVRYYRFWLL